MSGTPLCDAVDAYIKRGAARFHMPGHKGRGLTSSGGMKDFYDILHSRDLTEAEGCGSLYEGGDCIAETESRYASLFGSLRSVMSAGGSTLCIQTMLALALKPKEKLICGRGCHSAAVNAMALLDVSPCWVFPDMDEATGLAKAVTAEQIRAALTENPDAAAVYITGIDYYGYMSDIEAISAVCREFGAPLLVDNAHGAFLRFLKPSLHPINLGAAMCCDSLHKTLPVLTGGAMLHIADKRYINDAKSCMAIFGSTSPNYIIMASVDAALGELSGDFCQRLKAVADKVSKLQALAEQKGFVIPKDGLCDPIRLTLGFSRMGYTGAELGRLIREGGIEPEMVTDGFCVLMAGPYNSDGDFSRLESFIANLTPREPISREVTGLTRPQVIMSIREAVFADTREVAVENAAGMTAGAISAPCPPGVPLVMPGELIDENLTRRLQKYGVSRLNVVN